jgi:chemotaxis response regulator CheB
VIYDAGGRLLAQNEASSVVFGMPRGPIAAGIARPVSLQAMADSIVAQCGSSRCS